MRLPTVGYVVKRYPRYSETFIVNELLAHEAAGLPLEIFSLYPPVDTHFQDAIARVRSPVYYLPGEGSKVANFWSAMGRALEDLTGFRESLPWHARCGQEEYSICTRTSRVQRHP
jgi:hypothetical protein